MSYVRLWGVAGHTMTALKKRPSRCRYGPSRFLQNFDLPLKDATRMDKKELIDCICEINRSAKPEFLAEFSQDDLAAYLEHLMELDLEDLALCS